MTTKTIYRFISLMAVLSLVLNATLVARAAETAPSTLATGKYVNLAWFYKPVRNGDLKMLAQNFSTFILTKNDEDERDALIASGVNTPILQYLRFDAIQNPGSCTARPWNNQVAYNAGDFCSISAKHADWFLLDKNGNRISYGGSYMMDPGNLGWRKFWLARARASQQKFGWRGVFLDNVEASLSKRAARGALPAKYPNDAKYQAAIKGFLKFIYTGYFQPENRPLLGNIIAIRNSSAWFSYLQYLDGAMNEGWAVDWSDGYLSASSWESNLVMAERTQGLGKYGIFVSQGDQGNDGRQNFAFASYLLVTNGQAAFRYADSSSYDKAWLYPNYKLDIGTPLGARYQVGDSWKRDFSNGSVTVDPVNHTATITVP